MRCPKKSSVFATLLWLAVILLGANAALADLDVSFVVPSSVITGVPFPITVNVTNTSTNTTKTFNRVAAGYALADMKIKGPYEVDTSTHTWLPALQPALPLIFASSMALGPSCPWRYFLPKTHIRTKT